VGALPAGSLQDLYGRYRYLYLLAKRATILHTSLCGLIRDAAPGSLPAHWQRRTYTRAHGGGGWSAVRPGALSSTVRAVVATNQAADAQGGVVKDKEIGTVLHFRTIRLQSRGFKQI
jgi:hypothetical protein